MELLIPAHLTVWILLMAGAAAFGLLCLLALAAVRGTYDD